MKNKTILVFALAFTLAIHCCKACTSSKQRLQEKSKQIQTNEVNSYPDLFTVDLASNSNHRYLRSMCPKARPSRTCQVVRVNLEALKAPKMRFLLSTQWPPSEDPNGFAMLKKTSEEGLDLVLERPTEGATATVTYKVLYSIRVHQFF